MHSRLKEILVAKNEKMPVLCAGEVELTTVSSNKNFDIVVKNVHCVPNITTNLLSVSQLILNGNKVVFNQKGCEIFNSKDTSVATADLINQVYRLNFVKSQPVVFSMYAQDCYDLWHRCFGHINFREIWV
ncbi:uncharacterized protein [Diabrotica undecimpunctata]|uniref:uncharacterized protein n=1 Tax=Diabrotica undecimpunctata TaxID=50387 RepID=UPI003B635FE0